MASDGHFPYRLFGVMMFLLVINIIGAGLGYGDVQILTVPANPVVCASSVPIWCTALSVWDNLGFVSTIFTVVLGFGMVGAFNLTGPLAFIVYVYGLVNLIGWVIILRLMI